MARQINFIDKTIPTWKLILLLAWPAVVEQLLQTIVNYVDMAMVGSIGVNSTAAVGLTTSIIWMINGLMNAVGVGYSVLAARNIGAGRPEEAKSIIRQAVLAIVAVGTVLTLLVTLLIAPNLPIWMNADREVIPLAIAYLRIYGSVYLFNMSLVVCSNILRCSGDTKTPMKFNLLTNMINVAGNFMLIYPTTQISLFGWSFTLHRAGWGVAGAAVATAIATAFTGTRMLLILFRKQTPIQIHWNDSFRPNGRIIRQAIRLGTPVALEQMTLSLGHLVSTAIITGMGTVSLASHQLASTGESLCYLPAGGFSMAGTSLVAQSLGAEDEEQAFRSGQWCLRLAVAVMVVCSVAMYIFSVPIIDFFTNDAEAIQLAAKMLRIEAFAEPLLAIGVVTGGILRGAGDIRWPVYISLIGMWVVRLPFACMMVYGFHWGLSGIWLAMIADWMARSSISMIQFYRKRWLHVWNV